jgi:hypothetical protein
LRETLKKKKALREREREGKNIVGHRGWCFGGVATVLLIKN